MLTDEIVTEIHQQLINERTLATARHYVDAHPRRMDSLHEWLYTGEDRRFTHLVEDTRFLVVHLLRLFQRDLLVLLQEEEVTNGVNAACTFCGVGVGSRHRDTKLRHRLLPGNSMMGHGVVKDTIHIKQDTAKALPGILPGMTLLHLG